MSDQAVSTPAPPTFFGTMVKNVGLLRESRVGMFGAVLVLFWVIVAILAPILPLQEPNSPIVPLQNPLSVAPDGSNFWLGTDHKGRDILSRLVWGSQLVLFWASVATVVAYTVGVILGLAAGYLGGWWDEIISFLGNILLSFPVMVLYLIIITNKPSWLPQGVIVIAAVTFGTGPAIMRIVRGLVLDLRTRDYVAAAEVRGERPLYIMIVELLPNARGPLIVDACLRLGYTPSPSRCSAIWASACRHPIRTGAR